jgi:hypothetical protein
MEISQELMASVKRKLNITWEDEETDARLRDVIPAAAAVLRPRLALPASYEFTKDDPEAYALLLNACLYEFSNAIDDFLVNYGREISQYRLLKLSEDVEVGDAQV